MPARRARRSGRMKKNERISICVLPFVNMSGDAENEYFSDGIAEEILNLLTKLPQLKVASRTSSFNYKGARISIPDGRARTRRAAPCWKAACAGPATACASPRS